MTSFEGDGQGSFLDDLADDKGSKENASKEEAPAPEPEAKEAPEDENLFDFHGSSNDYSPAYVEALRDIKDAQYAQGLNFSRDPEKQQELLIAIDAAAEKTGEHVPILFRVGEFGQYAAAFIHLKTIVGDHDYSKEAGKRSDQTERPRVYEPIIDVGTKNIGDIVKDFGPLDEVSWEAKETPRRSGLDPRYNLAYHLVGEGGGKREKLIERVGAIETRPGIFETASDTAKRRLIHDAEVNPDLVKTRENTEYK